jgi:hypothetical protein
MSERDNVRRVLGKWDGQFGDKIVDSLGPDETLLAAGPAVFEGRLMGKDSSVGGALFVTNERVIKMTENALGVKENDSIPLEMISSVDETTLLLGLVQVKITAPDTSFKGTGRGMKGIASEINKARREKKERPEAPNQQSPDPLQKLERLGELLEKGLITQAEFDQKKLSLLGEI